MVRLACVDLPRFPLQLLLRRRPEWRLLPAGVVSKDSEFGTILFVNRAAERAGVFPGRRYAAGLALSPHLRAGTVSRWEIEEELEEVARTLSRFSPGVERSREERGVFWLDAAGLTRLYPSAAAWAGAIRRSLSAQGLHATVAVGFSRFGTYAAARSGSGELLLASARQEREAVLAAPLEILALRPELLERFQKLGFQTVGDFLRIPAGEVASRFGAEAQRIFQLASGQLALPLQPDRAEERLEVSRQLPALESDRGRLLHHLEGCLSAVLEQAGRRGKLVAELELTLHQEDGPPLAERIRPASPTLDRSLLLQLLDLRIAAVKPGGGIVALRLAAAGVRAASIQEELFGLRSRWDLKAGALAFARLRARLGEEAVVRARLQDAHLPERSFTWERMERPLAPEGARRSSAAVPQLVRRLLHTPAPLPPAGGAFGRLALSGPYVVAGRWWQEEGERDYYFARAASGRLLWLFYDRRRDAWFLCGEVR